MSFWWARDLDPCHCVGFNVAKCKRRSAGKCRHVGRHGAGAGSNYKLRVQRRHGPGRFRRGKRSHVTLSSSSHCQVISGVDAAVPAPNKLFHFTLLLSRASLFSIISSHPCCLTVLLTRCSVELHPITLPFAHETGSPMGTSSAPHSAAPDGSPEWICLWRFL